MFWGPQRTCSGDIGDCVWLALRVPFCRVKYYNWEDPKSLGAANRALGAVWGRQQGVARSSWKRILKGSKIPLRN